MRTKLIVLILAAWILTGCKKDRTCECGNLGGIHTSYAIRDTKKNAETKCNSYCVKCYSGSEEYCTLK